MSEHILKIKPAEVRITIDRGQETATATGIAFDSNAEIISESSRRFSGFCDTEIVSEMAVELVFTRHINGVVIDMPQISAALAEVKLPMCQCDD